MQEQAREYKGLHPEDVRAAIRKKFGTIGEFHKVHALPKTGVHDVLRGRASARVETAIDKVLAQGRESTKLDSSADIAAQHLNTGAK